MCKWQEVTVEELAGPEPNSMATGPFGSNIGSKFFMEEGVPVIRGSNLSDIVGTRLDESKLVFVTVEKARELARNIAKRGDLIFTCWGTIGQVGLIDERSQYDEYVISNKQMKLTPDTEKADSLFLYYLLSGPEVSGRIRNQAIGSSVPGFNLGQLKGIRVRIPPLRNQRHIAHILGTLDDKIELNRRMNRTLEAIARAIFKSWFIDFDPVIDNAILNGNPIPDEFAERAEARREILARRNDEGVTSYRHLFPDEFQDSNLGPIPKGWEVSSLDGLLELSRKSIKPQEHPAEEFDHFSIPAYDAGSPAVELGEAIRSSKHEVPPSAVLISKLNPHIPRVWLPQVDAEKRAICSTEFLVCVPKSGVPREYVYNLLSSRTFLDRFAQLVTGTTGSHQRVHPATFLKMNTVLPTQDLCDVFARSVRPMLRECGALLIESRELAETREALLPELMTGRFA